jgi:hypothetical protein
MWFFGGGNTNSNSNTNTNESPFNHFPTSNEILKVAKNKSKFTIESLKQHINKQFEEIKINLKNFQQIEQIAVGIDSLWLGLSPSEQHNMAEEIIDSDKKLSFRQKIISDDKFDYLFFNYDITFDFIIEQLKLKLETSSLTCIKEGIYMKFDLPEKQRLKIWDNLQSLLEKNGYSSVIVTTCENSNTSETSRGDFAFIVYPFAPIINNNEKFVYYPKGSFPEKIHQFYCFIDGYESQPVLFKRVINPTEVKDKTHVISQFYRINGINGINGGYLYQGKIREKDIIFSDGDVRPILSSYIMFEFCDQSQAMVPDTNICTFPKSFYCTMNHALNY